MSIQAVPSLLQNKVQILNANLRKKLIRPGGDNVLPLDIADLSDHCPVILLQNLEVGFVNGQVSLALSIAFHTLGLERFIFIQTSQMSGKMFAGDVGEIVAFFLQASLCSNRKAMLMSL